LEQKIPNGGENKKTLNTGGSEFELNSIPNRQFIKKPKRVICSYIVFHQNPNLEVYRFENDENTRLRENVKSPS
jgi:hypothetical protein